MNLTVFRHFYWVVPIFASVVWASCLVAMFVYWGATGKPIYSTMDRNQRIPYISDIGADTLKPMFIAMSAVSVVSFDFAFLFERWLRHQGKLARNTSNWQKVYSACAIIAAIVGAAGLILLTIFDTKRHSKLHNVFLCVFIGGYIISAIFICWEYQRLGMKYREHGILRYSFWVKLAFILLEIGLVVAFGSLSYKKMFNVAAVLEWTISFVYCGYVLSFFMDFLPVVKSNRQGHQTEMTAAEAEAGGMRTMGDGAADSSQYFRGSAVPNGYDHGYSNGATNGYSNGMNGYTNGATNGYSNGTNGYSNGTNGYTNGHTNGNYVSHDANGYPKPAATQALPSRNF